MIIWKKKSLNSFIVISFSIDRWTSITLYKSEAYLQMKFGTELDHQISLNILKSKGLHNFIEFSFGC